MTLPSIDDLEKSLILISKSLATHTLNNLDRNAEVDITISQGEAHIKVEEKGSSISHTMRVHKIEQLINKGSTQAPSINQEPEKKEKSKKKINGLDNSGVKDMLLD